MLAAQDRSVAEVLLRAVRRGRRAGGAGGLGVRRARARARRGGGGSPQGLGGTYDDIFLPLHGEHQAQRRPRARGGRGAPRRRARSQPLDPRRCARVRGCRSPGRLERLAAGAPTVLVDAAHNPHGARALAALTTEFRFTRLVGVVAVMRDKDARGILAELEPVVAEVVVTANSSPRAMDPDELGALAVEVFGSERVSVEPRLDEAIEQAGELAEEEGQSAPG